MEPMDVTGNSNQNQLGNDDELLRDIQDIINNTSGIPEQNGAAQPPSMSATTTTSNWQQQQQQLNQGTPQPIPTILTNITHATHNHLTHTASLPAMSVTPQIRPQLTVPTQQQQRSNSISGGAPIKPYIRIVEQPIGKGLRFRYECEGRSAGSIPGANSTPDCKTYPTVEIVGYKGEVVLLVSCVSKDPPYKAHPHKLVGKDGLCKDGIYTVKLTQDPLRCVLSNVGIQCVKKRDVRASLEERERRKVDPFKNKFDHKDQPSSIDLNVVRLCFQAFIRPEGVIDALDPVVSDTIFEKKAHNELIITRLCSCAAKVGGGDEIIMLCDKVTKEDIKIRFYEISKEDKLVWEDFAEFQQSDVHKQTAIAFKTPRYHSPDVKYGAKVYLQLVRPSDNATSEPRSFEYYPDPGMRTFSHLQRKLKRKQDLDIFEKILSLDSETTTKYSCPPVDLNDDELDQNTVSSDDSASKPQSTGTLNDYPDNNVKDQEKDCGEVTEYPESLNNDMEIELEVPQLIHPVADDCTQTSTPMEEILRFPQLEEPRNTSAMDKINDWMRSSEFERTDSLIVENGDLIDSISLSNATPQTAFTNISSQTANTTITNNLDDDKEVVEKLDEEVPDSPSRRDTLESATIKELPMGGVAVDYDLREETLPEVSASAQASVDIDETFDETATYTSLQIAFNNPIEIPAKGAQLSIEQDTSTPAVIDYDNLADAEIVVLTNPPAPKIRVNAAQTPATPPSPILPIPPRTPSPDPDQKLPPLPPKPRHSQDLSVYSGDHSPSNSISINRSRNGSLTSSRSPTSQIVIMRTPDQSPTKRQPQPQLTPTASPKKRQGFFSRLFSRRKSKGDLSQTGDGTSSSKGTSKATTPTGSREPSVTNFSLSDANRASMRSVRSVQPTSSASLSPQNSSRTGKPVGRSSSSVSGKRPAYLDADVIHIPLKGGESENSLCVQPDNYSNASTLTYGRPLDRKTLSTLQLADIPISDGNMELVAIADRQSIKNLCEGAYGVVLDPSVDLFEAEHFALYTSVVPDEGMAKSGGVEASGSGGDYLSADEIARRLAEANDLLKRKRQKTDETMNILERQLRKQNLFNTQIYRDVSPNHLQPPAMSGYATNSSSPTYLTEIKAESMYHDMDSHSSTSTSPFQHMNMFPASPASYTTECSMPDQQQPHHQQQQQQHQQQHQQLHVENYLNVNGLLTPDTAPSLSPTTFNGGSMTPIHHNNQDQNMNVTTTNHFTNNNIINSFEMCAVAYQQQQQQQQHQQQCFQQQSQQQQHQYINNINQQVNNYDDILPNSNADDGPSLSGLLADLNPDDLLSGLSLNGIVDNVDDSPNKPIV